MLAQLNGCGVSPDHIAYQTTVVYPPAYQHEPERKTYFLDNLKNIGLGGFGWKRHHWIVLWPQTPDWDRTKYNEWFSTLKLNSTGVLLE